MNRKKSKDYIVKICPHCGKKFQCFENNVTMCQCSTITMDESMRKAIAEKYSDCLCLECLTKFAQRYKT